MNGKTRPIAHAAARTWHLPCMRVGIVILALAACLHARAEVTLVQDGRSRAVIVVPAGVDREVGQAGRELQAYIEKCTGARIDIVAENRLEQRGGSAPSLIYLGSCEKTGEVIDLNGLEPEELVIRTSGSNLFIVGRDGGTLYGVYHWLREYLGVDWIMPGELGEVTPARSTLSVADIDYRYQPAVLKRKLRSRPWNDKTEGGIQNIYRRLGRSGAEEALLRSQAFYAPAETGRWFSRWGEGERIEVQFGHSFNDYWEKYGEAHPEFFALQPNGSRKQNPTRERLCVSEPGLWDFVAERKIEEFMHNPGKQMASICPNDGGPNLFCICERCLSWDPQHAPKIRHRAVIDPKTGKGYVDRPSLSDRYFRFYNEVAERVAGVFPDKRLGVYAYSVYQTVPVSVGKLHPNLAVQLVSLNRQLITDWSRLSSRGQLFLRPNIWHNHMALSQNNARWLAESVSYGIARGVIGFDCDGNAWNWGTEGLDYYVLVRAMWDPSADPDRLIEDFCQAAYGAGAPAMRKYWDRLEGISTRVREEGKFTLYRENIGEYGDYYLPAVIAELQAYIDAAKSAVRDSVSKEYRRIEVVEDGLRYTDLVSRLFRMASRAEASDPHFQAAHRELLEYLEARMTSYSMNPGKTYHYISRALTYARR
jgi:hypothetical protein